MPAENVWPQFDGAPLGARVREPEPESNDAETESEETEVCTCEHCSEHCEDTQEVITGCRRRDTEEWCADCVESDAVTCDGCGNLVSDDETTSDDTENFCPQCMEERFRCDDCDSIFPHDSANSINDGDRCVCDYCYRQYRACANCGCLGLRDDMYYRDDWYCSDCDPGDSDDEESDWIHPYSHKPLPHFHGKGPRYFGVELEVEVMNEHYVDDCAQRVQDYFDDFAYLKSDGSLTRGFEIVTHPASLEYHRGVWGDFYTPRTCKGLKSFQTTTCGLHVHISRAAATTLTWSKFVSFISEPSHQRITEKIAMRSNSAWCTYFKKPVGSRRVLRNGTHGDAVNCANRDTVEVRIFKGTLRGLSVIRAIEYCDSVLSWCKDTSHTSLTYNSYFCWLRKRRKEYLELWSFLEAKNLVAHAAKPNKINPQTAKETEEVMSACV